MNNKTMRVGRSYAMISFISIVLYILMSTFAGYDLEGPSMKLGSVFYTVQGLLWLVAAFCAYVYFGNGARKEDAKLYKAFAFIFVLTQLMAAVVSTIAIARANLDDFNINGGMAITLIMVLVISFFVALLLSFVKNLGKKNSKILVIVSIICSVAIVVFAVVISGPLSGAICGGITRILLALTMYEMVKGKYEDKDARGTI